MHRNTDQTLWTIDASAAHIGGARERDAGGTCDGALVSTVGTGRAVNVPLAGIAAIAGLADDRRARIRASGIVHGRNRGSRFLGDVNQLTVFGADSMSDQRLMGKTQELPRHPHTRERKRPGGRNGTMAPVTAARLAHATAITAARTTCQSAVRSVLHGPLMVLARWSPSPCIRSYSSESASTRASVFVS